MMTRAKESKYYSSKFFELADTLSKFPETVIELEFPTRAEARAFRMEFYTFRACAEKEGLTADYPELCAIVVTDVRPEGKKLRIMHKDFTPGALVLGRALEKVK